MGHTSSPRRRRIPDPYRSRHLTGQGSSTPASRKELARERTDWAHERTLMAKERTFAAWSRTGVACLAAGLAIARLIEVADHTWIVRAIGLTLIGTALFVFTIGFLSYRKTVKKLEAEGIRGMPLWAIGALTIGLMLSAGIGVLLIFQE